MKNVHLLPTDKPSRLYNNNGQLHLDSVLTTSNGHTINQHLYITSDEEIKEGDWYCHNQINYLRVSNSNAIPMDGKRIILTTDPQLIANGVQAIDDEFLEWFVKNPSCEEVEVHQDKKDYGTFQWYSEYKIIIPKEELTISDEAKQRAKNYMSLKGALEPKQETLEEASLRIGLMEIELNHTKTLLASCEKALENRDNQAQRMYSEEEVKEILMKTDRFLRADLDLWFEQFKKK